MTKNNHSSYGTLKIRWNDHRSIRLMATALDMKVIDFISVLVEREVERLGFEVLMDAEGADDSK